MEIRHRFFDRRSFAIFEFSFEIFQSNFRSSIFFFFFFEERRSSIISSRNVQEEDLRFEKKIQRHVTYRSLSRKPRNLSPRDLLSLSGRKKQETVGGYLERKKKKKIKKIEKRKRVLIIRPGIPFVPRDI